MSASGDFKRKRNFTEQEKNYLVELVQRHQEVITSKDNKSSMKLLKDKVWNEIHRAFNEHSSANSRTLDQLKKCWENLRTKAKREYKQLNVLNTLEENKLQNKIISIIGEELEPPNGVVAALSGAPHFELVDPFAINYDYEFGLVELGGTNESGPISTNKQLTGATAPTLSKQQIKQLMMGKLMMAKQRRPLTGVEEPIMMMEEAPTESEKDLSNRRMELAVQENGNALKMLANACAPEVAKQLGTNMSNRSPSSRFEDEQSDHNEWENGNEQNVENDVLLQSKRTRNQCAPDANFDEEDEEVADEEDLDGDDLMYLDDEEELDELVYEENGKIHRVIRPVPRERVIKRSFARSADQRSSVNSGDEAHSGSNHSNQGGSRAKYAKTAFSASNSYMAYSSSGACLTSNGYDGKSLTQKFTNCSTPVNSASLNGTLSELQLREQRTRLRNARMEFASGRRRAELELELIMIRLDNERRRRQLLERQLENEQILHRLYRKKLDKI